MVYKQPSSIYFEQIIALFQHGANEVLPFALQIIIYLLIGFGKKALEDDKKWNNFLKTQECKMSRK